MGFLSQMGDDMHPRGSRSALDCASIERIQYRCRYCNLQLAHILYLGYEQREESSYIVLVSGGRETARYFAAGGISISWKF